MSGPPDGSNLPGFIDTQLEFSAHIRNPHTHPRPEGLEARRMQIYVDLFFNNINSFVSTTFPVAKSLFDRAQWRQLVRNFVHLHGSESPYFLQVSEEFLTFLSACRSNPSLSDVALPDFLLELCHYEWVEMSLDVAQDVQIEPHNPWDDAAPLAADCRAVLNPYVRLLTYQYPVQNIGPGYQPDTPPTEPTYLVVYRTLQEKVRFMASNPLTHRLLTLLGEASMAQVIQQLSEDLADAGRPVAATTLESQVAPMLHNLHRQGIVLGWVQAD